HVVVEANATLVPALMSNRDRNGCRFRVLNRAVAYSEPLVRFHVDSNILASSVRVTTTDALDVPVTTLHGVLDAHRFARCSLICDIEGAEVELVRHEARTLSERVAVVIMEVHDRLVGATATESMLQTLRDGGFRIVARIWDSIALENTCF